LAAQGFAAQGLAFAAQGLAAQGLAAQGFSAAEHGFSARAAPGAAATTRPLRATADPRTSMDFFKLRMGVPFFEGID